MSEQDEIDWDKVLNNPDDPKPEVKPEQLWMQLERMRQAQKTLPKWMYFKQLLTLMYILIYITLIGFMVQQNVPFMIIIIPMIGVQMYLDGDYFVLTYRLIKQAKGENKK